MPDPSILYATDEDVFVRDPGNFIDLMPDDQLIAAGTDGVINSGSPWVLTSASGVFLASGLARGHILHLDGPTAPYGPEGALMAVDSVASNTSLTMRRIGAKSSGLGQPLAASTGIIYSIRTFGPQIEDATYDLNRRYGVDDNFADHSAAYLYDARTFRQAVALTVLLRMYTSESRTEKGDWASKRELARSDLEELLGRLTVKWGSLGLGQPATTKLSTRITR